MLFNSLEFLIFFPLVLVLYYNTPHKWRWLVLLGASYYFYMAWKAVYVVLILASTLVDYFCARRMSVLENKKERKPYLYLSLLANLGLLLTFKYYNFFSGEMNQLASGLGMDYAMPAFQLILPMGISFYTFQTLSYSVDVYKGDIKAEKHLGVFALFVSFFPQLVAGPIERAKNLLPQFHIEQKLSYDNFVWGASKVAYGFFKKVVVADRLAVYVDAVYNDPSGANGVAVAMATFLFAIQIYCDFSGYSDIAIGSAKMLGFDLMENFRRPYLSKSIAEFWKRWHISLSTWFRDYTYIPLGGNRVVKWRWYYNLMITFLVSGLWHGANWTFIVWGAMHGAYLVTAILLAPLREHSAKAVGLLRLPRLNRLLNIGATFVLVLFAWIFFRSNNMSDSMILIESLCNTEAYDMSQIAAGKGLLNLLYCGLAVALLVLSYALPFDLRLKHPKTFVVSLTTIILLLGRNGSEFIYFQF